MRHKRASALSAHSGDGAHAALVMRQDGATEQPVTGGVGDEGDLIGLVGKQRHRLVVARMPEPGMTQRSAGRQRSHAMPGDSDDPSP